MIKKSLLRWAVVSNNNVYNRLPVCPPSYMILPNQQYRLTDSVEWYPKSYRAYPRPSRRFVLLIFALLFNRTHKFIDSLASVCISPKIFFNPFFVYVIHDYCHIILIIGSLCTRFLLSSLAMSLIAPFGMLNPLSILECVRLI